MDSIHLAYGQPDQKRAAAALNNGARANQQQSHTISKRQRHRHSKKEWNELHDTIAHLYIDKDKKAEEVLEILDTQHNFRVGLGNCAPYLLAIANTIIDCAN